MDLVESVGNALKDLEGNPKKLRRAVYLCIFIIDYLHRQYIYIYTYNTNMNIQFVSPLFQKAVLLWFASPW